MKMLIVKDWTFKVRMVGAIRRGDPRIIYSAVVRAPNHRFAIWNGMDTLHARADNLWFRVMTSPNLQVSASVVRKENK